MVWRQGRGAYSNQWTGPMKVVVHEIAQTIWATMAAKLYRAAPEHVRPVSAMEAKGIVILPNEPSISIIAQQIPSNAHNPNQHNTSHSPIPDTTLPTPATTNASHQSPNPLDMDNVTDQGASPEHQPDAEPGAPGSHVSPTDSTSQTPSPVKHHPY